ncbi:MAG: sulfite exporter TauE/SafE family protein [Francisellaceae bacterium]
MTFFIILILAGCLTGLIAGLLGIGGGIILVPVLAYVFSLMSATESAYIQFAAGTSLAVMIFTSISAVSHKLKHHEVNITFFKKLAPWIIAFNIIGAICAHFLHPHIITLLFALLLAFMFFKMMRQKAHIDPKIKPSHPVKNALWGSLIGIKSGLFGIGGGMISIPYLHGLGLPMKIASGTSSAFTFIIAITGTTSFIISGHLSHLDIAWTWGYVYLPAVIAVAPTSMIFAKIGAKLATKTSAKFIKWLFLCVLFVATAKMIWLVVGT